MRSLWLLLAALPAALAAPVIFPSSSEAQTVGPCCAGEGETHPPDPHNRGPIFVPAEVARRDERALEATAEAPITADVPLVDVIGVPLEEERRGVSEPARVSVPILAVPPPLPQTEELNPNGPPCCQAEGETHPPDRDPEETPPVLMAANVKSPDERALKAAAEVQIQTATQLLTAIGIPLDAERGVSEPAHVPAIAGQRAALDNMPDCCTTARDRARQPAAEVDAPWAWLRAMQTNAEVIVAALIFLLAIGFLLRARRRRRPQLELEPLPSWRPLPGELPQPDAVPVPQPEPEVVLAKARKAKRELA
jgi:hypothetical protein